MGKNATTSKIIDEIIRYGTLGGLIGASLFAPGMSQALDKPLRRLTRHLDENERRRELRRIVYGMKARGYLVGEYEHGLQLTEKAKARLATADIDRLEVQPQQIWDKKWRIIMYDIPEEHKYARDALTTRLRRYGCFQLQKSTWITPFPCRKDIETITAHYGINAFVSYFEAINLDNQAPLLRRFKTKYPSTKFL